MTTKMIAQQATASVSDGNIRLTVTGVIDSYMDWEIKVELLNQNFYLPETWTERTGLYSEEQVRDFARDQFIEYVMEQVDTTFDTEDVEIEVDEEDN